LRIGTASGGSDILNPMADENNGFRKLLSMGNTNFNINWEILNLEDGIYYWSVQAIDGAMAGSEFSDEGIFTVGSVTLSENESLPQEYRLEQNFPNPFNPITKIRFTIPTSPLNPSPYQGEGNRERLISLKVYGVIGNEIATLVNEEMEPGIYEVEFDAKDLTSGVYFYSLTVGSFTDTKKMILLR
jgi:hypothetical protein